MEVEDNSRNTSLHLIIQSGNTSMLKIVSTFEPDFSIANNLGDTPLHVAVSKNDLKMVQLLKALADPSILSIKNKVGQKPLDLSTDSKMRFELQSTIGSQINGVSKIEAVTRSSQPRKFTHQRSNTPTYSKALQSVLKGDQLNSLVNELQGSSR